MIKTVITLLVIICILASVSSFFAAKFANQQDILHAREELEDIRRRRDTLLAIVAHKDSLTDVFEKQVLELSSSIMTLRGEQEQLETERRKAVAAAFRLFQPDSIMNEMRRHWPEMARSGWGFKEIFNEQFRIHIEYFMIPTQFTTTFIQDHIDAANYQRQRDKLLEVDSLRAVVSTYKDSLIVLERDKKEAYRSGYNDAYAKYEALNEKYIKNLENPQIELGVPFCYNNSRCSGGRVCCRDCCEQIETTESTGCRTNSWCNRLHRGDSSPPLRSMSV